MTWFCMVEASLCGCGLYPPRQSLLLQLSASFQGLEKSVSGLRRTPVEVKCFTRCYHGNTVFWAVFQYTANVLDYRPLSCDCESHFELKITVVYGIGITTLYLHTSALHMLFLLPFQSTFSLLLVNFIFFKIWLKCHHFHTFSNRMIHSLSCSPLMIYLYFSSILFYYLYTCFSLQTTGSQMTETFAFLIFSMLVAYDKYSENFAESINDSQLIWY